MAKEINKQLRSNLEKLWAITSVGAIPCIEVPIFIGSSKEHPFILIDQTGNTFRLHDMSDTVGNMVASGLSVSDISEIMILLKTQIKLEGRVMYMDVTEKDIPFAVSEFIKLMSILYSI